MIYYDHIASLFDGKGYYTRVVYSQFATIKARRGDDYNMSSSNDPSHLRHKAKV